MPNGCNASFSEPACLLRILWKCDCSNIGESKPLFLFCQSKQACLYFSPDYWNLSLSHAKFLWKLLQPKPLPCVRLVLSILCCHYSRLVFIGMCASFAKTPILTFLAPSFALLWLLVFHFCPICFDCAHLDEMYSSIFASILQSSFWVTVPPSKSFRINFWPVLHHPPHISSSLAKIFFFYHSSKSLLHSSCDHLSLSQ